MSDYTPTTEEVHAAYLRENDLGHPDDLENAHTEFIAWLASVKAEAFDEGVHSGGYWGDPDPLIHEDPPYWNPYREEN